MKYLLFIGFFILAAILAIGGVLQMTSNEEEAWKNRNKQE